MVNATPPAALPPGRTRCPLYRGLGGPQGRSGHVRKISPQPAFDPRPAQKTEISLPCVWPFDLGRDALDVGLNAP